jgi:hypothetical protein
MLKLKPDNAGQNANTIKSKLESLRGEIPALKSIDVYQNIQNSEFSNCDVVLECVFDNYNDCVTYQNDPLHKKVLEFIRPFIAIRSCIEYYYYE